MKKAREAVYEALCANGTRGCFLRLSRDDRALWVTDFPIRQKETAEAEEALRMMDVEWEPDGASGLWRLNWTPAGWRRALAPLPKEPPPLPSEETLHPAYALCRLLLCHPAPLEVQPMERLCQMAKAAQGPMEALTRMLPAFHSDAAKRLRMGQPLPFDAGRILAARIAEADSRSKEEEG